MWKKSFVTQLKRVVRKMFFQKNNEKSRSAKTNGRKNKVVKNKKMNENVEAFGGVPKPPEKEKDEVLMVLSYVAVGVVWLVALLAATVEGFPFSNWPPVAGLFVAVGLSAVFLFVPKLLKK